MSLCGVAHFITRFARGNTAARRLPRNHDGCLAMPEGWLELDYFSKRWLICPIGSRRRAWASEESLVGSLVLRLTSRQGQKLNTLEGSNTSRISLRPPFCVHSTGVRANSATLTPLELMKTAAQSHLRLPHPSQQDIERLSLKARVSRQLGSVIFGG